MEVVRQTQVILYVESMAASFEFYHGRFGFPVTFPTWETDISKEHWVTLDAGGTSLALHAGGTRLSDTTSPALSFSVSDIEEAKAHMESKGVAFSPIEEPHPGVRLCHTKDPDGLTVFLSG